MSLERIWEQVSSSHEWLAAPTPGYVWLQHGGGLPPVHKTERQLIKDEHEPDCYGVGWASWRLALPHGRTPWCILRLCVLLKLLFPP
jgi:hypothetical protein